MENKQPRLLRAEEIDVRVGQTSKQGAAKPWVSYLLYKDARCDMQIMDETFGAMNWQREHSRDNANCTVSVWNGSTWVKKEDTGVESQTEKEKGLASDSFKRACVNWGIGRELYTAPRIVLYGDPDTLKYMKIKVDSIEYNDRREIKSLILVDDNSAVVFKYPKNLPSNDTKKKSSVIVPNKKENAGELKFEDNKPLSDDELLILDGVYADIDAADTLEQLTAIVNTYKPTMYAIKVRTHAIKVGKEKGIIKG